MNFKFKRLYHRIFSIFLVIVLSVLSVPTSAVAKEGNEESLNISTSAPISDSTIATDLSQEVIWPVVSDEEAMRREQLIQNGYSPDDYSVSEYKQMVAKGELQPLAVYPAVLADGVYAIKNIGNSSGSTGFYLDTALAHWLPGYNMQQYKFENGTSPLDNFEVSTLFKITRNPSTGSYIIRIMRNNALSFGIRLNFDGSTEILSKKIPLDDSSVALTDTYSITVSGSGYKICKYGTTNLIATKDTTASGAAGAPDSYLYASSAIGDHARWTFSAYTGPERNEMTMLGSGSLEVAKTSTLDPVFYSTRPGYNVVSLNMSQIPTSYYTLSGPSDYGIYSLTPHQGTAWNVGIYLKNGSSSTASSILVKNETWNIALPIDEGVYFLNNVEYPNKYVQINNNNSMLDSGEIIELHKFYSYYYQKWEVEHVLDGYYKIISQYSGLELTAPTGYNNDVVTQTTPSSANTHLWKFIKQSDGTYRISPKSNSNYFMAAGAESSAADQDLEIRTTQSDNSDEWYLHKCSEYVFVTLNTIMYYAPNTPHTASQLQQKFEAATAKFISEYNIRFNLVSISEAASLTLRSGCVSSLVNIKCTEACGNPVLCSTLHHRGAGGLITTLTSNNNYVCRVVEYRLCNYKDADHHTVDGLGEIKGTNTIVADTVYKDLIYLIQHELTHNFGTDDHGTSTCVMNQTSNIWCANCSSIIRDKYRG